MVRATLDIGGLATRVVETALDALDDAVGETLEVGVRHAKRLAPVRQVSYTARTRTTRSLTLQEARRLPTSIRASAIARIRSGQKVLTTVRRSQQDLPTPAVRYDDITERATGLRDPSQAGLLDRRGRAELRIAREQRATLESPAKRAGLGRSALFVSGSGSSRSATLGGRLRGEIDTIPPVARGARITGWIISPTEYARYVEFPTSRTAAQPYMRPTLKFIRRSFKLAVRRNLKRHFRTR